MSAFVQRGGRCAPAGIQSRDRKGADRLAFAEDRSLTVAARIADDAASGATAVSAASDSSATAVPAVSNSRVPEMSALAQRRERCSNPRLAELAEQVRRLSARRTLPHCPSGLPALDRVLGGGFARGAVHELLAPAGSAAVRSLALLTATRAAGRQQWIFYIDTADDFYPPGAAQLEVPLERLLVVRAPYRSDALWACEQSLRCRAAAAVILPIRSVDAYVSRRLQLAAEAGENLGLLLCSSAAGGHSFAASRLRFEPLVGERGVRRMAVAVLKLHEGQPGRTLVLDLPDAGGAAHTAAGLGIQSMALPSNAVRQYGQRAG